MENINTILHNINKLLDDKNLNRTKISVDMKLNRTTLYNYLDGKTPMPVEFLMNLCAYLNIPVSNVLNENAATIDIDTFMIEIKKMVVERINKQ
jgi:transcriptional regulator with XRE-family HTH domain